MSSAKNLCVLGGAFAVLACVIVLCIELCKYLFEKTSWSFFDFMMSGLGIFFNFVSFAFIILFFICFFGKKIIFLQNFIEKFPKTSLYLEYIGWVNYVLYVIDGLVLVFVAYTKLNENVEKYVMYGLVVINILAIMWALISATRKIFFSRRMIY